MPTPDRLPKLVLDPANEGDLVQLAYNRIRSASGGVIDDFRPGSTVAALVEGQTFALMELLYYVNLLPEAIAIEMFSLFDVTRNTGTRSTGDIIFRLTNKQGTNFTIPAGYSFPYLDTTITTTQALLIPAGAEEASVTAIVDSVGAIYNANPFDIAIPGTGLGAISNIYNRFAFTGGTDAEPLADLIDRCRIATTSRNTIVTRQDYVTAAQQALGSGSKAVAIGNTAPDGISYRQDSVAIFLLDATGKPASSASCAAVANTLSPNTLLGTSLKCLPAILEPVDITINLNMVSVSDPVAQQVIQAVYSYLKPVNWVGDPVVQTSEVEYVARQVTGVTSIDSVLFNGQPVDYLLAQPYSYLNPTSITVNTMDKLGSTITTQVFYGGTGI